MRTDVWGRRRLDPMGTLYAGEERLPNPQGGFFRPTWGMQQQGGRVATMTPGGFQTERDAPDRFAQGRQNVTMLNRPLQSGEWAATASGTRAPQVVPGINYEGVAGLQRRMMATGRGDTGAGDQDRNGDGYPDGAEVERKVKAVGPDGQETVTTAKWIHRGATSNQNTYQGDPMRFSDAQRDAISQRQALAGVGRDTGRMRQFMDVRARQDRPGLEEQARELKRLEFEAPALANAAGMEKQGSVAAEIRAGADTTISKNTQQTELAKIADQGRQFDTKIGEKPQVWKRGEESFVTYNGQVMKLGDQTPDGFMRLTAPDGELTGWMNKDGIVVKKDGSVDRPTAGVVYDNKGNPVGIQGPDVKPIPVDPNRILGGNQPPPSIDSELPTMTPDQARMSPRGTRYRGTNGKVYTR